MKVFYQSSRGKKCLFCAINSGWPPTRSSQQVFGALRHKGQKPLHSGPVGNAPRAATVTPQTNPLGAGAGQTLIILGQESPYKGVIHKPSGRILPTEIWQQDFTPEILLPVLDQYIRFTNVQYQCLVPTKSNTSNRQTNASIYQAVYYQTCTK